MGYVKSINKDNLKIARENIGLDTLTVSKKMSTSGKDVVLDWENGKSLPTWSQVDKLSKIYNIPELVLFSNDKIEVYKKLPDYRVGVDKDDTSDVKKLINITIKRQEWLEKKFKSDGINKNILQGSGRDVSDPKKLAEFIKKTLSIDFQKMKGISGQDSRRKVLKYLINKVESNGVFVGKTISYHKIEVDDMRGMFISNDYAPFIILNRKDALSAQIFSFIHELAHLFRKSEGISNSLDFRKSNSKIDKEETFCNRVSAEFLLPEDEFDKKYYTKNDIGSLAETYKLSRIFIFFRLKDLRKIRKEDEKTLEDEIKRETNQNTMNGKNKNSSGGDFNNNMKDSNGDLFNKVVSNSYLENKINYTEASRLLRFSVEKYD